MSWLLVGVAAMLVGLAVLLSLTNAIVAPVVTAAIIAAVLSPLVRKLHARGLPRAAGAAFVFLAVVVIGAAVRRADARRRHERVQQLVGALKSGASKLESDPQGLRRQRRSGPAGQERRAAPTSAARSTRCSRGVGVGVKALGSIAIFLSFTALSLFFLLKDGPQIRGWVERHMGVPHDVGRAITERMLQALRGYFTGVTAVAAFNAIVIGLGALVLGVDDAGAIALVNFVAAYIPYLGAWSAGAFTVLLALGSQGTTAALIMVVIVLLANGLLQQMIQPIAFGAALGIHPLAVLIVTIAGGALFGMIGLVLAAPITSAVTHIAADLARARVVEEADAQPPVDLAADLPIPKG